MMISKSAIKRSIIWGLFLLMAVFLLTSSPVFAETCSDVSYRDIGGIGSRNLIWILSQVHILFGAFVLGVPIFVVIVEVIGITTGEKRYDRLAKEFTDLIVACFATTATLGLLFLFALLVFYPELMRVMAGIFKPAYYVYLFFFLGETTSVYFYWSRWEKWQDQKALHLFWGMMLNIFGFVIMCLPSGFLSFQASPILLNPELGAWERA